MCTLSVIVLHVVHGSKEPLITTDDNKNLVMYSPAAGETIGRPGLLTGDINIRMYARRS